MHLVENGVQYENNHGLSEGSTIKMSKIYTYKASMAPKVKNPIMYKHLTKRNRKKKKNPSRTISKLVKSPIHKPRFESN